MTRTGRRPAGAIAEENPPAPRASASGRRSDDAQLEPNPPSWSGCDATSNRASASPGLRDGGRPESVHGRLGVGRAPRSRRLRRMAGALRRQVDVERAVPAASLATRSRSSRPAASVRARRAPPRDRTRSASARSRPARTTCAGFTQTIPSPAWPPAEAGSRHASHAQRAHLTRDLQLAGLDVLDDDPLARRGGAAAEALAEPQHRAAIALVGRPAAEMGRSPPGSRAR